MINLLSRLLIRNRDDLTDPAVRRAYGMLCGWVGIALNVMLFAGKLAAGLLSGSIAVTADAVNNLSDAGSSVVTLLGFRLAAHGPDREHPFGHGRAEYVSGLVVAMVIVLMGVELGRTSVEKIFQPQTVDFGPLTAGILAVSIGVKLYMAAYNRAVGRKIHSAALSAAALDSLSDCLATGAVLLGAAAGYFWQLRIDGWCGLAVAGFILWSGVRAAREAIGPLLGQPPDPEYVAKIREIVLSRSEITGVHDLIVHDYGPGRRILSLHAEVPASGDLMTLHDVVDGLERELSRTMGCLATIHMDPVVRGDARTEEAKARVAAMVGLIDPEITIHDFRMVPGADGTKILFDAEAPFQCALTDQEIKRRILLGIQALDSGWFAVVEVEKSYI